MLGIEVIVLVWSTKHHAISFAVSIANTCQRIAGVSAVPGHTQPVLTSLVADRERRVFRRLPLTAGTLDLSITEQPEWRFGVAVTRWS